MSEAVALYRRASEENGIEGVMRSLAAGVELVSPLSGRFVFRDEKDVRILLTALYNGLRGWRWREELGEGSMRAVLGDGKIGPFKLADVMVVGLDDDGRILRIRPYLRPWLGTTFLALVLGAKMAPHPGVMLRAARGG